MFQEILQHADELAKRFEDYEPKADDERASDAVKALRRAVIARSDAERVLRDAVDRGTRTVRGPPDPSARHRHKRP